jgi:hypothetical protein
MANPGVINRTSAVLASSHAVAAGSIAFKAGSFDGPDENVGAVFPGCGDCVSGVFRPMGWRHQPIEPGTPLKGPTTRLVIHPP